MIKDNLRIVSLDAVIAIRVPENFVYPANKEDFSSWINHFTQLSRKTSDVDLLRSYNAYRKIFKLAKSKSKITSIERIETGEISFTFSFRTFPSYAFFIRQIGYFTDNR